MSWGNRVYASEKDVLYTPRVPNGIGLIYCHGANGTAAQAQSTSKGIYRLTQGLAREGFHVLAPDLGGDSFGNDTLLSRMEASQQVLVGAGCNERIVLIGASMGNLSAMRYMADHPDNVLCAVGIIPAIDIDQLRSENWNGIRTLIETAWSIGTNDPIPDRGKPLMRVDDMAGIPWSAWYSDGDTVVQESDIQTMASALGGVDIFDFSDLDHTDSQLLELPYQDVINWILDQVSS